MSLHSGWPDGCSGFRQLIVISHVGSLRD
jgi:hypothetical protein